MKNYNLNLPVTIDPDKVSDITDKMLIEIYMLRITPFPSILKESKLRIEAINNIKVSNLYFYTNTCMVGKKNIEYKTQTGDDIRGDCSILHLN